MERKDYEEKLAARTTYRKILFGEINDQYSTVETNLSLAGLALRTKQGSYPRNYTNAERYARSELNESVAALLEYHDSASRLDSDTDYTLFRTIDSEALGRLTQLTSGVIWKWEVVCKAHGQDSPFVDLPLYDIQASDLDRQDVQMVLETAAAICELLNLGYGIDDKTYSNERLVRVVAIHGPAFATAWARGDIIREYCAQYNLPAEEWLQALTTKDRVRMARITPQDPLNKFVKVYTNLTSTLSTANIARMIGWSEEKVGTAFTWSDRKRIAMKSNPQARLMNLVNLLTTSLSDEQLAVRYSCSPDEAASQFSLAFRIDCIVNNPNDPLGRLDAFYHNLHHTLSIANIAAELEWTEEEARATFNPNLINRLARTPNPMKTIRHMAQNKDMLDSKFLAEKLGKTPEYIDAVFTTSAKYIIIKKLNPLAAARRVIATTNLLRQKYNFPDGVVRQLAGYNSTEHALKIAETIVQKQAHRPPGVSEGLWASAIAKYPNHKDDAERHRYVASYLTWYHIQKPLSLAKSKPDSNYSLIERVGDSAHDPAEMFDATDPSEELEALAARAEVSTEQLKKLLLFFEADDGTPDDGELVEALQRLRAAQNNESE